MEQIIAILNNLINTLPTLIVSLLCSPHPPLTTLLKGWPQDLIQDICVYRMRIDDTWNLYSNFAEI